MAEAIAAHLRSKERALQLRLFVKNGRDVRGGLRNGEQDESIKELKRTIEYIPVEQAKVRKTADPQPDLSDKSLKQLARFTDTLGLQKYQRLAHLIPRIVKVVSVRALHLIGL